MRNRTRLGLVAVLGATALMVACGDDENPTGGSTAGTAGTLGGSGGSTAGSTNGGSSSGTFGAGTGGTAGASAGTAGAGGATAGSGGATAGGGGTTAGTGGVPHVIVPTVFIVDNVRLQLKGSDSGSGGEGGFGGDASGGAAGEGSVAGAGGLDAGGAGAGAGGAAEGGAGPGPAPDFLLTFDTAVAPLTINANGFSPSVGGDTTGPAIFDQTTLTFDAAAGKPGGAAKISVPFSVAKQQADFFVPFAGPTDLTGYEIVADVKVTSFGDAGTCPSVWIYVWGGGYGNDKSGEPSMGVTQQLVKDEWTTVRLNLDGPYGYHSVTNHAGFKPTAVTQWGMQMNTFGCP